MANSILIKKNNDSEISGSIEIPGSKSETNRLLILGALTKEHFTIHHPVICEDTLVVREAFKKLGIQVSEYENKWVVEGYYLDIETEETIEIDLKMAGTALRFLTAFCCFLPQITVILNGSNRLKERPIEDLTESLKWAGFEIEYIENKGKLPYKIKGSSTKPKEICLDVSQTSQGLSALLLLSPILPEKFQILFNEQQLSSYGYINLTLSILESCGFTWKWTDIGLEINKSEWENFEFTISGDWTSASYFIGLSALYPGQITLKNLQLNSAQPDADQIIFPIDWGIQIKHSPNEIQLINHHGLSVLPIKYDFTHNPDLAQTYMFLATYAQGKSVFTGLETLPKKESNRIEAMKLNLEKWGFTVNAGTDYLNLDVDENQIKSSEIETFNDHRMAMAALLMIRHFGEVRIQNPDVVQKSFPDFWKKIESLGFEIIY